MNNKTNSRDIDDFEEETLQINGFQNKPIKYKKWLWQEQQLEYKYILNLDGFASAWRIIQELFYGGCIIIPNSHYTDTIRQILKPWCHYIPCKKDMSNLVETIKWYIKYNSEVEKIVKNMVDMRNSIMSLDNIISFVTKKIDSQDINYDLLQHTNYIISPIHILKYQEF